MTLAENTGDDYSTSLAITTSQFTRKQAYPHMLQQSTSPTDKKAALDTYLFWLLIGCYSFKIRAYILIAAQHAHPLSSKTKLPLHHLIIYEKLSEHKLMDQAPL